MYKLLFASVLLVSNMLLGGIPDDITPSDIYGNTSSNIISMHGKICEYEGHMYYPNIEDDNKLYKINLKTEKKEKVSDDVVGSINIAEGWIYYINRNNKDGIYKMKLDGSEKKKISDIMPSKMMLQDEWLYFTDWYSEDRGTYKIKVDGTNFSRVLGYESDNAIPVGEYVFVNVPIYDNGGIWRVKSDGSNPNVIIKKSVYKLQYNDGWLYYQYGYKDHYGIYKVKLNGMDDTCIYEGKVDGMVVTNEYIYFIDTANKEKDQNKNYKGAKICRFNQETKKVEFIDGSEEILNLGSLGIVDHYLAYSQYFKENGKYKSFTYVIDIDKQNFIESQN